MSREVRHDGVGNFEVRFDFDRELVDRIKLLPTRRWNAAERFWSVPEQDVVQLVDLLHPARFRFDTATVSLYRRLGGAVPLPVHEPTRPQGALLPGLFDPQPSPTPTEEREGAETLGDDYTVSRLNLQVRLALEAALPAPVWLVGEISGFNRASHKRHVGFQLLEHDEAGQTVSRVDAILFADVRRLIARQLEEAGSPFSLEDEVAVRLRVRVDLYVPWGSYRVVVEQIDLRYTLGEAARRREEIVRRLTVDGLVGRNTALTFPGMPLRVGVITSLNSDAYNDVVRTLQESGFGFRLVVHGARVQGRATEPSVLNALDWFRQHVEQFDVVLICRGGGSRTDLAWFDSEALGRTVALFPLPVVIGIGHEQDHSVLDAVGWRCKTPTAAAALLVETVRGGLERLETMCADVLARAARQLDTATRQSAERARHIARAARNRLSHERIALRHHERRVIRVTAERLRGAEERLRRTRRDLPRAAVVLLAQQRAALDGARRGVVHGARRDIAAAWRSRDELQRALAARARQRLTHESERADARARRLALLDPRRVIERGYALLRLADGTVLTRAAAAPAGSAVVADLREGRLRLRSEGDEA